MMCFHYLNWVELVLSTYSVNHPKTIIDFQKELRQRNSIIIFSFNKYSRAFCPLGEPARWAVIGLQERKFFISTKEMCVLSTSLLCWAAHWCCHHMVHTALPQPWQQVQPCLHLVCPQMSEHRAEEQGTLTVSLSPLPSALQSNHLLLPNMRTLLISLDQSLFLAPASLLCLEVI